MVCLWYTGCVAERYKRKPNTSCFICNKSIYRRPSEIEEAKSRVFCSVSCYGISCRKEIPCIVCKKPILAGFHKITCSRSCANIHRTGISYKINQPKSKVKSQQAIKIRVLKLRGKNCERCHYNQYEILQIHHKNRNKNDNNLDNLELICPNCHFKEHYLEKSWLKKVF